MDYVLYFIGFVLLAAGLVGSFLPVLPGPPLGWAGLFTLSFTSTLNLSASMLIWTAVFAALITALDYLIPIWGTKKFGGTKAGIRGSTIGLIIGLFFGPLGIILGPALGAFVGEMMVKNDANKAMKSAVGSFIGFLLGTGIKVIYGIYVLYIAISAFFEEVPQPMVA